MTPLAYKPFPLTRLLLLLLFALSFSFQTASAQTGTIENCGNGIDDDGDGLIDCADRVNCDFVPICSDEAANNNCSDGIDNDGDGDIDCADSECDCTQAEICNNYRDDDGDGLVDCQDGDCDDFVGCERECNNGIDDDGDGFYDYYDGDCVDDPNNPNDYVITKPDCEARPEDNVFDAGEAWRSADGTVNNRGMPVIADIDNDGTPEVITLSSSRIHILNGATGATEEVYAYPNNKGSDNLEPLAVGDIDNDGYGEIFHLNDKGWLRAMDYDPVNGITLRWEQQTNQMVRFVGLADFNGDGKSEVFFGNEIRDALTGGVVVSSSHGTTLYPSGNNWLTELNGLPVAVDILPNSACADCGGLELVLGHVIYSVDIAGGKLTEERVMDAIPNGNKTGFTGDYHTKTPGFGGNTQSTSTTAVVDYNQDGFLDVIMSGASKKYNGPSTIFFWDVQNNSAKAFVVTRPASSIPVTVPNPGGGTSNYRSIYKDVNGGSCDDGEDCTWNRGTGALNVANIDSDLDLEITFMSGSSLYAIDQNMQPEWDRNIYVPSTHPDFNTPANGNHVDFWESTSGVTGTAVFDFDGDGASEIVYRDQVDLYIVDGQSGQVLNSQYTNLTKCSSNTAYEYPIIADVDGDGETEIIVSCANRDNERYESAFTNGNTPGHIRAYKAVAGTFWVPSRSIWNQFAYFNVNVNDNMTIPAYQQPHHLNFSQICSDPSAPSKFSLNKFLNQSPRITFCGDLAFPASKLDFADGVGVTPPICPEDSFQITISFENSGDYPVNQPIPLAFYSQDPTQSYTNAQPNPWLDTLWLPMNQGLAQGERFDTTVVIRGARGAFELFASLNDVGPFDKDTRNPIDNQSFYPLDELNGTVRECDGTPTILSEQVDPTPFRITATTVDNRRCGDGPGVVNNGEVRIVDENGDPLSPLSNYLFTLTDTRTGNPVDISASVTNQADETGTVQTTILGLDSATYELDVRYQNAAFSCGSVVETVSLDRLEAFPDDVVVSIIKDSEVSSCAPLTADGAAHILIDGVVPDPAVYTIRWANEQNSSEELLGDAVTTLRAITYDISIRNELTGCVLEDSSIVMDLPLPELAEPIITAVTRCDTPNGAVTAQLQSGDPADYRFVLISQGATQDTIQSASPTFNNVPAGFYELKAIDLINDCGLYQSGRNLEVPDNTVAPAAAITQVSPQTACEESLADGHLRANPTGTAPFTYAWYRGSDTQSASAQLVSSSQDAENLYTYGNTTQRFTLVLTDATGCSSESSFELQALVQTPVIDPDPTVSPLTHCSVPNGSIAVTVGGTTTGYTFALYAGTAATGTPLEDGNTSGSFTALDATNYTVVATQTSTGCTTVASQATVVSVPDDTQGPVVLPSVTVQSSCDINDPNGAITLSVDGAPAAGGYTFAWSGPGIDATNQADAALSDLPRGNYRLTVTNSSTTCDTTFSIFVDEQLNENAALTLDVSDVTNCTPYNGEVEVTAVSGFTGNLSDYDFRWYQIAESGLDSTLITGVSGAVLGSLEEGTYSVQGLNTLTQCITRPQRATVGTTIPQPTITLRPVVPISTCADTDGVFELDVEVSGVDVSDQYTYAWYLGSEVAGTPVHTGRSISGIVAGTFTIEATSLAGHGCKTVAVIKLSDLFAFLPVFVNPPSATHITACGPAAASSGEVFASVRIIPGLGSDQDDQDDFVFYWFAGRSLPPVPGGMIGQIDTTQALNANHAYGSVRGTPGTGHTLNGIPAGEYTVVVYNNSTGCFASDFTEVLQIAREPVLTLDNQLPETQCDTPDGQLEVTATKRPGDTTPAAGPPAYTFTWYSGSSATGTPIASNVASTSTSSTISQLTAGEYTLVATDLETSCTTTATYTVRDERNLPVVVDADITGTSTCLVSNGALSVTRISSGGLLLDNTAFADFTFFLYNSAADYNPTSPATNSLPTGSNDYTFESLAAGTYFLAVRDDNNQCMTPFLYEVVVPDEVPIMNLYVDNEEEYVTCVIPNTGELSVRVDNTTAATFTWYAGSSATGTPIATALTNTATTSTISELTDGQYTVTITDDTGQACPIEQTFTVAERVIDPVLALNKLSDQTICNPDGGAEITSLTLDGNNLTVYTIEWYVGTEDAAGLAAFNSIPGVANGLASYTNLPAGTYLARATATASGCVSNLAQVIIEDQVDPLQVRLDFISDPITGCIAATLPEGTLEIEMPNGTGPYSIQWYDGEDTSAPIIAGATSEEIDNLVPGPYTVEVVDTGTGCRAVRTYNIIGIDLPLDAFPSALPQTSCRTDNGAVSLTIAGTSSYQVNWFAGTSVGTPEQRLNPGNEYTVEGLPAGQYTVQVIDQDDPTNSCIDVIRQVRVGDGRANDLDITVQADFPVSNCDVTNPNGELSVQIPDPSQLFRYEFFWYEGTTAAGNPIAFGPTVTQLGENQYRVVARDRSTGCLSEPAPGQVITLLDSGLLPAPTVVMTAPLTRCNEPDGIATATLDSSLTVDPFVDYQFEWFNDQGELFFQSNRTNRAEQLDTGRYTVIVRNLVSGCVSAPAEVFISDSIYLPEMDITTTPSFCEEPSGTLVLNLYEVVDLVDVSWQTPYGEANGDFLDQQPAGHYTATITLGNGCQIVREAYVEPHIDIYNALSPNGDGQNDLFFVACLESFENNIVRIFNRAGSLVFLQEGYDNEQRVFTGVGNQGLYLGGKDLPDGTYFYVVDKRNGEQPLSGYVELLR